MNTKFRYSFEKNSPIASQSGQMILDYTQLQIVYICINTQQMNYFSSDFKLGILGGGQLGKMLLHETRKFDIQTFVLDPNPEAPCAIACNHFFEGDIADDQTVDDVGKKVDVL